MTSKSPTSSGRKKPELPSDQSDNPPRPSGREPFGRVPALTEDEAEDLAKAVEEQRDA
ncbi:hypothetical protein [Devosia sp. FKR38]|uniref:hypothetical protein n=1 Tax=Devosia sp. FKR38 TaxID=2562312 RepID=UPI001485318E|nr:hypothetical protein [Devosia sp. FKR38]